MKNILNIIVHDFRRLTSSVVALVILMGIIVIPCLFAWFNILSNDDPFEPESTSRIPVAVATEDSGAEMLGMSINVGEIFIDTINGDHTIGWEIVEDKDQAVKGVKAGDYYAAIVVPEDFSENVMSFATGELKHPKVLFYENEKTNAIAPKITEKVGDVLEEEIDNAFIDTLGSYITEAANAANAAGLSPQDVFSDLSSTMDTLNADLGNTLVTVRAAAGLSDAAGDLLAASDNLIDSSEEALGLGEELLKSSEGEIPEKADTTSVKEVVKGITALLSKDLSKTESDLASVRNDMNKYNQFVQKNLSKDNLWLRV